MTQKRGMLARGISHSKRGQVTIFIIVGILILVVFAALLYFSQKTVEEDVSTVAEPLRADVPQTFQPIQTYTENCLSQVGKDGLLLLGQQGGYIDPGVLGEFSVSDPTEGNGIDLSSVKVPYWYFNQNKNDNRAIALRSLRPALYAAESPELSVESQLGRYVKQQILSCLNQYKPFQQQGFVVTFTEPEKATVTVTDETVNFLLEMPVHAEKGESDVTLEQFYVKIPLRLKHYYDVAKGIADAEQNMSFLEGQALDLVQTYAGVDPEKLPPTYDLRVSYAGIYWNVPNVKENYQSLLNTHIPMLRYLGSANMFDYTFPVSDLSAVYQENYENTVIPLTGAEDLAIDFNYFNWPIYLHLSKDDSVIGPQELLFTNYYGFPQFTLPMQRYRNYYDISYPVLVTVHDPLALSGEGYTFNFALEANLRNNWRIEPGQEVLPAVKSVSSLVCNKNQRNSQLVKTIVVDSFTGNPLDTVRIGLTIPEEQECVMGLTNSEGELETQYPLVIGGVANFIKEGYLTNRYPIDTYDFQEQEGILGYAIAGFPQQVVPLHRVKTVTVTIKKLAVKKCIGQTCYGYGPFYPEGSKKVIGYTPIGLNNEHSWIFTGEKEELTAEETATIQLERMQSGDATQVNSAFQSFATLSGNGETTMQLVPGVYKVSGTVMLNKPIIIPQEERCVEVEIPFWFDEDECFEMKGVGLDSYVTGQLQWNEKQNYLTITADDLYNAEGITFYIPNQDLIDVPADPHTLVLEDLQVIGELVNASRLPELRSSITPTFG